MSSWHGATLPLSYCIMPTCCNLFAPVLVLQVHVAGTVPSESISAVYKEKVKSGNNY